MLWIFFPKSNQFPIYLSCATLAHPRKISPIFLNYAIFNRIKKSINKFSTRNVRRCCSIMYILAGSRLGGRYKGLFHIWNLQHAQITPLHKNLHIFCDFSRALRTSGLSDFPRDTAYSACFSADRAPHRVSGIM